MSKLKPTDKGLMWRIEQCPDDVLIRVGAAASYIFIGSKQEFYEDVQPLNRYFLNALQNAYSKSAEILEQNVRNGYMSYLTWSNKTYGKLVRDKWDEYYDYVGQLAKATVAAYRSYTHSRKTLEQEGEYIPLEARNIYRSRFDGNMQTIIIPGEEIGMVWVRSEYQEFRQNELAKFRKRKKVEHGKNNTEYGLKCTV